MRLLPNKIYTTEPEINNVYNEIKYFIRQFSLNIRLGTVNVYVSADNKIWHLADGSPFGAVFGKEEETISNTVNWKYIKYTPISGNPTVDTTCESVIREV